MAPLLFVDGSPGGHAIAAHRETGETGETGKIGEPRGLQVAVIRPRSPRAPGAVQPEDAPARAEDFDHCLAIRTRVFVEGQGVSMGEEMDGLDAGCTHFLVRIGGEPAGTARLRRAGGDAKAERVAVLQSHRRAGVGRAVMEALEREARRLGHSAVLLHAQTRVIPFYERLGYRAFGAEFEEAGISHRRMSRRL